MARPDKAAAVAQLQEEFSSSAAVVLTEYRGLTVKNLKDLRRSLGEDASYAVAKNTLALIAAKQAGIDGLDDQLTGPTAFTFIRGDVAQVAKGLRDFAKANPLLVIKGGVLEGRVLDADQVKTLADLESREVLLSKLAGAMKASLSKAVGTFAAPLTQAAQLLGALETKAQEDPSAIGGAGTPAAVDQKSDDAQSVTASAPAEDTAGTPASEAADAAAATTDAAADAASKE
ncbi:MAG: 50S ribosomal protein L10 [Brooklawnia sp.]|uniref:50S ribosomal protein L10 n=1 Tax=Brooklawnia sp. TaxID=2699740 RepID=UPI003C70ACC3